jgi:hypothetical protein
MNPFEPGGGEIPPAPVDVPIPDFPAANFSTIAAQKRQGEISSGFWGWLFDLVRQWIPKWIATIVGGLLGLVGWVVAWIMNLIAQTFQASEFGTDAIAAAMLAGMTGQPMPTSAFTSFNNTAARESIHAAVYNALINTLKQGATPDPINGLTPTDAGAKAFMEFTTRMGVEGWLAGALIEALGGERFEQFAELKDILERSLGLGRLARRVLAAPTKIFVEDPYTELLNQQYHPTKLAAAEYVREYLRGILNPSDLQARMDRLGHSPANTQAIINLTRVHLSPEDIFTRLLHGEITNDDATNQLTALGYDQATAATWLHVQQIKRTDAWLARVVEEALVALEKRAIDRPGFNTVLSNSGLPQAEKDIIGQIADYKVALSQKFFSLAQAETLVKKGLWTMDQLEALATREGFSPDDETTLELLTLGELTDAAATAAAKKTAADNKAKKAAATAAALEAKAKIATQIAEAKGVSIAKYETLVKDGLKTIQEYQAFLVGKGLAPDNVAALTTVLQAAIDKTNNTTGALPALSAAAKAKNLNLSQLAKAVLGGHITLDEYTTRITQAGFDEADVQILVELLQDQISTAATKAATKTAAGATLKAKNISLSAEQHGVRLGLVTLDQYQAWLTGHGFDEADVALLAAEMQNQLAADAAARVLRGQVASQGTAKGLSLAQVEKLVRAGVKPISDYTAALAAAGYDSDAQASLVALLQLIMQQDQESLAAHGRAAALLAQVGLSLTEIEAAVKKGVEPMTAYTDQLAKAGVSPSDANILALTLAASVKSTATTPATTTTPSTTPAP